MNEKLGDHQEIQTVHDTAESNQANGKHEAEVINPNKRDELLQQSRTHLQNIITKSADGLLIADRYGFIQFVNPAAEDLFGRSAETLLGTQFGFPVVAGETTELQILQQNKGPIIAEMRVVEVVWEGNIAFLASLRDVTERKKHEQEIQQRNVDLEHRVEEHTVQVQRLNERINAIFRTASEVILLVASDGRIDMVNPSVMEKFGYSPEELNRQPISVLVTPSQREKLGNWVKQVVNTGQSQRQQVSGLYKDGSTFDMEISLARVRDNDNHIVCILHDISHLKAVERMKDNFISMVSHELRSPITSLSLIAGTLERFYDRYTDSQIKQKLTELTNQSEVLIKLIEGILDISRLEAQAGQPINVVSVDLVAMLTTIVTELKVNANEKKQSLTTSFSDGSITFSGNHLDLARIWRNLISNAIKYTHDGGRIAVRLAQLTPAELGGSDLADKKILLERLEDGRQYIIGQVEDNGHGINPADIPTLFQRFNRGWAQTSNIPGTGLGLALVRELLTLYKGDIHASSQLGQGSIFTFWIPVA